MGIFWWTNKSMMEVMTIAAYSGNKSLRKWPKTCTNGNKENRLGNKKLTNVTLMETRLKHSVHLFL